MLGPRVSGGRVIGIWGTCGRELDTCQVRAEWQVYTWMEGAVTGSEGSGATVSKVGSCIHVRGCEISAMGPQWHLRKVEQNETEESGKSQCLTCSKAQGYFTGVVSHARVCLLGHTINLTSYHGGETFESHWSRKPGVGSPDGGRRGH